MESVLCFALDYSIDFLIDVNEICGNFIQLRFQFDAFLRWISAADIESKRTLTQSNALIIAINKSYGFGFTFADSLTNVV